MLQITIPIIELWDERKQEFIYTKEQTLQLEHSLVSLSKWEAKWRKAFFSRQAKTFEETLDYIKCMTITQNVKPEVYKYITDENIAQINKYIEEPMTATYVSEINTGKKSREQITSELIYYWMIMFGIPFECQKWHLSRLLTLIRVCNAKNRPPQNMSKRAIMKRNSALNAARKKRFNTKG